MLNKRKRKILLALSGIGPGLFLIGYNIGTGSVTTMAKSGAEFGMSLFWVLIFSCIFTYIMMVAYGQVTLITGHTSLHNIKNNFRFGKVVAIYILLALISGELLALMGIMGIVADLLKEAFRLIGGDEGFSTFWIILVLAIGLYLLLWWGGYPIFEKTMTFFVIAMGLCFILVFLMVKPSAMVIINGLVPQIPKSKGALTLIAAIAGTTCSAAVFVMRSIVVAEKGWTIDDLQHEKKDAFSSAFVMLLLSGVIMAVSAGTLHVSGLKLVDTVEMIQLFEPLGGKVAAFTLILGISAAGLSTVFPIILIAPWLICDYMGKPRDIHSPLFRILGFLGILFCFGMQFMEKRPPAVLIFSQAFQAVILPAVVIPIFLLINRKNVMQKYTAGVPLNIGLTAVLIFALVTTCFAIVDIF